MKAAAARRGLEALAKGVESGKEAVMRYREGGMQGVFDPEYAAKQKEAREKLPELRAELGVKEPQKPAEPQKDEGWWGDLMGGVGSMLGKKDQVDLKEYAQLKGLQGQREAETRRARATSPLWPYMKDPTRAMPKSWGFGPGDITIEHPRGEPKPEKPEAWNAGYTGLYKPASDMAMERAKKLGMEKPTSEMVQEDYEKLLRRQGEIKNETRPPGAERDPKMWVVQYRQMKDQLIAEYRAKGINRMPTPDEIWARVNKLRPQSGANSELDALLRPGGRPSPSGPVADDTAGDDDDPGADDEGQDPDANVPSPNPILDRPPVQPDARVNPTEGGKPAKPQERREPTAGPDDDLFAVPQEPPPPVPPPRRTKPAAAAPPPSHAEDPDFFN